jgi:hypothetical protein
MENLIIVIPCIAILILFLIYNGKILKGFNKPVLKEVSKKPSFIPSDKFIGENRGYVFKKDKEGLGYYIDKVSVQ